MSMLSKVTEICQSISRKALSAKTIGEGECLDSLDAAIRREKEVAIWLQQSIWKLQCHTQLSERDSEKSASELEQDLLDETLRSYQEEMLVQGIQKARVSCAVVLSNESEEGSNDNDLVRHACQAHFRQCLKSLQYIEAINKLEKEMDDEIMACRNLHKILRHDWQHAKALYASIATESSDTNNDATERTQLLQGVMRNLIIGNNLDWFHDDILRRIMVGDGEA
jgi:hypothetical protein